MLSDEVVLFGKRYVWTRDEGGKLSLHPVLRGQTVENQLTHEGLIEVVEEVRRSWPK